MIRCAVPDVVEERMWKKPFNGVHGVLVWSHHGTICTGESDKDKVRLTFARGAALDDTRACSTPA